MELRFSEDELKKIWSTHQSAANAMENFIKEWKESIDKNFFADRGVEATTDHLEAVAALRNDDGFCFKITLYAWDHKGKTPIMLAIIDNNDDGTLGGFRINRSWISDKLASDTRAILGILSIVINDLDY